MKKSLFKSKIQNSLFFDAFLIMFLNELACIGAGFIDGLIVSNSFGNTAIAAVGLVYPLFSVVGVVSGMLTIGTQKNCINYLGQGKQKEAEDSFNTSILTALFFSVLLVAAVFIFQTPILKLLGAKGNAADLFDESKEYLLGLAIGIPALLFVPILTPIAQVEGKKKSVLFSMISIFAFNVLFDYLSIVFNWGVFGIGLATSIAQTIGCLIIAIPIFKEGSLKINRNSFSRYELLKIMIDGTPKLMKRLCNVVKPITINVIIISLSGSIAMSAMSIRNNLSNLLEAFGAGLGGAVALLTALYVGEKNKSSLQKLTIKAIYFIIFVVFPICLFVFMLPNLFVNMYVDDQEVFKYAIPAIRSMAVDVLFVAIMEVLTNYWQGCGKTKATNAVIILQKFLYPLAMVAILGSIFGIDGIWYALPLASLLSILTFGIINLFNKKEKIILLFFPIPSTCKTKDEDVLEYVLFDAKDVSLLSSNIQEFCLQRNIDKKRSYYVSLAFEEMITNIVDHGFPKDKKKNAIDVYIAVVNDKVVMRIRDNCVRFDLIEKFNHFKYDANKPEKMIGIRLIMKMASDIKYVNTFGTNTVIITI